MRAVIIILLGLLVALSDNFSPRPARAQDTQSSPPAQTFPVTGKRWTLAFYFAGENSLENDCLDNLREICEGAPALKDANIVIFFDRDDDKSRENIFTTWKGTRIFSVNGAFREVIKNPISVPVPASIESHRYENMVSGLSKKEDAEILMKSYAKTGGRYILMDLDTAALDRLRFVLTDRAGYLPAISAQAYSNLDATKADTLLGFISFVQDNFISQNYALFIVGHGNGWFVEENIPDASKRRHSEEYYKDLETPVIKAALMHADLDVLVLDICFMGDIETAWALKDTARYLVFNQTSIPSMGLDYADLLARLGKKRHIKAQDIAFETVQSYKNTYEKKHYPVSATALALGPEFTAFVRSFQRFVQDGSNMSALKAASEKARYILARSQHRDKMVDLIQFIADLKSNESVSDLAPNSPVIHHFSTNTGLGGISIYLPRSRDLYNKDSADYAVTDFARDFPGAWVRVLPELVE